MIISEFVCIQPHTGAANTKITEKINKATLPTHAKQRLPLLFVHWLFITDVSHVFELLLSFFKYHFLINFFARFSFSA